MPRLTEDKMLTKTLLQHFALEAEFEGGNGQFYALMLRDNGDLMATPSRSRRASIRRN
jgi:hypothetical protein